MCMGLSCQHPPESPCPARKDLRKRVAETAGRASGAWHKYARLAAVKALFRGLATRKVRKAADGLRHLRRAGVLDHVTAAGYLH